MLLGSTGVGLHRAIAERKQTKGLRAMLFAGFDPSSPAAVMQDILMHDTDRFSTEELRVFRNVHIISHAQWLDRLSSYERQLHRAEHRTQLRYQRAFFPYLPHRIDQSLRMRDKCPRFYDGRARQ